MIYRKFGKTGIDVSVLGFGGMRFPENKTPEDCASLVKVAYDKGINYFDTAPLYCNNKSEEYFGIAFKEMKKTRQQKPFYVATKTFASKEYKIRRDLENSLSKMGLETIDFYYVWCVLSPQSYKERIGRGVLKTFQKLKEEGLIRHICFSTHMNAQEIQQVLEEYPFEAMLMGYSAMNFAYREAALEYAEKAKCAIAIMNPLGGGLIPQNPDKFAFLKQSQEQTVLEAALHFLINDTRINTVLVGMKHINHLKQALLAVDSYQSISQERIASIKANLKESFNELCTSCGYCDHCPQEIPIPKLMDSYNQYLLSHRKEAISERLKWHWELFYRGNNLDKCTQCGQCERVCTQHLPIIQRLKEIQREIEIGKGK